MSDVGEILFRGTGLTSLPSFWFSSGEFCGESGFVSLTLFCFGSLIGEGLFGFGSVKTVVGKGWFWFGTFADYPFGWGWTWLG